MDLLAFLTSISAQLLFYAAWRGFEVRARNGAPESAAAVAGTPPAHAVNQPERTAAPVASALSVKVTAE
jgi:hypothetical protein